MCKLGGFFAFEKFKNRTLMLNLVRKMLLRMESGGRHATGIALIDSDLGLQWHYKIDKPASEFVNLENVKRAVLGMSYNIILLHTRLATHGSPSDNKNNHPFYKEDNFLIHNGVVSDYQRINELFDVTNESECDSETILSCYNKEKNIKDVIKELSNSNAFTLYDSKLKQMFIYGTGYEVEIMYNKSKDFFAFNTTRQTIIDIFNKKEVLFKYFTIEKVIDEIYPLNRVDEELITIDFVNESFKKEVVDSKKFNYNFDDKEIESEVQEELQ